MRKKWIEALAVLAIALACILVVDRLTNRLDQVVGHTWDFVYYIDMAEHGLIGNTQLVSPYAYRWLTPWIAGIINQTFHQSTYVGFRLTAYAGLTAMLVGVYLFARRFKAGVLPALMLMFVPVLGLFNVKFLLFNSFRPDQLAYPLMVFSILALLDRRWGIALLLSLIGLQTREYLIIPPLIILFEVLRAWRKGEISRERWLGWTGLVLVSTGAAVLIPRLLLPVAFTQQIIDPFHDKHWLSKTISLPFNGNRDINILFNIVAYWMPFLILFTPARFKQAWSLIRRYHVWLAIYLGVCMFAMMYGGADFERFATFFFIPQSFLLVFFLMGDIHVYELFYLIGAMVVFNRLTYLIPIWDFNAYLDFYGGYGDHVNLSALARWVELGGLIVLGQIWRNLIAEVPSWRGMTLGWLAAALQCGVLERLPWARSGKVRENPL